MHPKSWTEPHTANPLHSDPSDWKDIRTVGNLLDTLKRQLKTEKIQILQADKDPGLLLIHNATLTELYNKYLNNNATQVTPHEYNETLRKLKYILNLMFVNENNNNTDDRPPTLYFKIKTHKEQFLTTTTEQMGIYTSTKLAQRT